MKLVLENGDTYEGEFVTDEEPPQPVTAELVFTTAYTGYEESITDPSYNNQALVFSYPLIGNYGVDERRFESEEIQPSMVITREFDASIKDWFTDYYHDEFPACGVHNLDTRDVVTTIRDEGSMLATAVSDGDYEELLERYEFEEAFVTSSPDQKYEPPQQVGFEHHGSGDPNIALLDCGVKHSMLEKLSEDAHVIRFPHHVDRATIGTYQPDLLFVSNGPGNPEDYEEAIETVQYFDGRIPIAGICLGQQVITLALGGSTQKMKFGHRGSNQPVIDQSGKVRMTTQNHSYEVAEVPDSLEMTQWNVNDESPEGVEREADGWQHEDGKIWKQTAILARQYHPEANPGPNDSLDFFEDVLALTE